MKNLIFISAFTFLFNWTAAAAGHISRDSSWTYGGNGGLNLSQVSLSNWASGGENAVGFDVLLNYSADYKKNKHLWQNRIEMAYGLNQTETSGTKKTNDKLFVDLWLRNDQKPLFECSVELQHAICERV